jgi:hypothetical protein
MWRGTCAAEGLGTVLVDLLTRPKSAQDQFSGHLRFDIHLSCPQSHRRHGRAARADRIAPWPLRREHGIGRRTCGRGKPPPKDSCRGFARRAARSLAGNKLPLVMAPTLFIVGGDDREVRELNRRAIELNAGRSPSRDRTWRQPTSFIEPGALEAVSHSRRRLVQAPPSIAETTTSTRARTRRTLRPERARGLRQLRVRDSDVRTGGGSTEPVTSRRG